jgi:ABC-type multidrug transport system ATPase subunit
LGTNGAGKTTTMAMLTGEQIPSCGEAYIGGISVVSEMSIARRLIGYCPQFDALHDHMSPREHLRLYCRLRGLTKQATERQIQEIIEALSLTSYQDTMAKALSGGNKRKLSLGIALIGQTQTILLDEPSAGMDPVARRDLWKSLKLASTSRSVILTTHHLEEVEALADRVAIMVAGKMRCLGTLQELKTKFAGGAFELQVSFAPPKGRTTNSEDSGGEKADGEAAHVENFVAFLRDRMPQSTFTLQEVNGNKIVVTAEGTKLSQLLDAIEAVKRKADGEEESGGSCGSGPVSRCVTEYSLSQSTLEQVFLRIGALARITEQEHPDGANAAQSSSKGSALS